ncbi:MAG: ATP-binding protein [Candidatus Tectimicrobiota bacterium]
MNNPEATYAHVRQHMEHLERRLEEAESTLQAIRQGEVDALVVSSPAGLKVYTLHSADHPYRVLVEGMQDAALTLTPAGLILYANLAFARMLRTSLEHLVGTSLQRFVVPRDLPHFMALLERGTQEKSRGEISLRAQDGTIVPVFLACNSLHIDGFPSVCLVITDLTEQKRQDELLASEVLARAILDQTTEALVVIDTAGRIMRASQTAQQLAGRNVLLQAFETVFPLQFHPPKSQKSATATATATCRSIVCAALQGEVHQGLEATFLRPDGQLFQCMLSLGPLLNPRGEIAGGILTLTDITARTQAERALQQAHAELEQRVLERTKALRHEMTERRRLEREAERAQRFALLGRLAAGLSHEIRNPLASVFLHVDVLTEELQQPTPESSQQIDQALSEIKTQLLRLEELVEDSLSLVRVSGIELHPQDLGLYMQAWSGELQAQAALRACTLQVEGLEQLGLVACHPGTFRRVVLNLVQNAFDAMPEGGTVSLRGYGTATHVSLQIQDTGSGIAAEKLGRIFEPLYTTKPGGTGLGLYIVQEVVSAHGGQIAVHSTEGQGSTFSITLPRAPAAP